MRRALSGGGIHRKEKGMKVGWDKTDYTCVNGREDNGMVMMQEIDVAKLNEFKYLVSTV